MADGWKIDHGIAGDPPFFAAVILVVGGMFGALIVCGITWVINRVR